MRTALVVGSGAAAVVAWIATSGMAPTGDPELAVLLRGMAAIKGLLAISAAALVGWRLGQPVSSRVAATYVACVWLLFAGTVLIWQLAFILTAAVLFHAGALVGLIFAMREGRPLLRHGRRVSDRSPGGQSEARCSIQRLHHDSTLSAR